MKKISKVVVALMLVLAMTVSAFAAVSPTFATNIDMSHATATAVVTGADGKVMIVDAGYIKVTPAALCGDIAFKQAYAELTGAKDLVALIPALADVLPAGVTSSDLTVKEAFDVAVFGKAAELLKAGGTIDVTVKSEGLKRRDVFFVVHKGNAGWEVLPATVDNYSNVTMTATNLSPVGIIVLKDVTVDPNGPTSPATGDATVALGVACARFLA